MAPFPKEDFLLVAIVMVSILSTIISSRWWRVMSGPLLRPKLHLLQRKRARLVKRGKFQPSELTKLDSEIEAEATSRQPRQGGIRLAILWAFFFISRYGYILPLWGLFGDLDVVMLPQYQFMGIPRRLFVGASFDDLLINLHQSVISLTLPAMPTGPFAYKEEWIQSLGVVGWAAACHVVWAILFPSVHYS